MATLTESDLQYLGEYARERFDETATNCRNIALVLQERSTVLFDITPTIYEVHIGEIRETHFVNTFRAADCADSVATTGSVIVDASIDQFCEENQHRDDVRVNLGLREWLPSVGIYPPAAEERIVWYHCVNHPDDAADPIEGHVLDIEEAP